MKEGITMTDEEITECIKAFILHGLPAHATVDVSGVSSSHALMIDARFHSTPIEFNLGPLFLQIMPSEREDQFPAVSRQLLQQLADKKEAEVSGSFGDMRPLSVRFTIP